MDIKEWFIHYDKMALGLSGGVDSAYLLYEGISNSADIKPYYVKTAFQPAFELEDAKKICFQLGVELTVIETDITDTVDIMSNPVNRCYYCKKYIFTALVEQARRDGYIMIADGTNASDDISDRPGYVALRELSVISPLRECGLTKAVIRERSKEAGLFTWNKPAYACLATRIPTGDIITPDKLTRIEAAENELFAMGFTDFRVRYRNGTAVLQFTTEQLPLAVVGLEDITVRIAPYFTKLILDPKGRQERN